jgi:hypothetical protein
MTVARMNAEMSNAEYMHWQAFYGRRAQREEMAQKRGKT